VIIVNPSSGPGSSTPNTQYATAVRRLDTYSNVQKVGYVPTHYANRNITAVLDDVAMYANWTATSTALGMDGIFFDEIPYDWNSTKAEYVSQINEAVKNSSGIQSPHLVSFVSMFLFFCERTCMKSGQRGKSGNWTRWKSGACGARIWKHLICRTSIKAIVGTHGHGRSGSVRSRSHFLAWG
jgi:hypothetical protein